MSNLNERLRASPTSEIMLEAADYIDGLIAQHHRDSAELRRLCAARDEARKERDRLRIELRALMRGYVGLLESGRDRILDMGGECDPVDVMEASDPWLKSARAALQSQDSEEVMEMALCESRRLVLRIGQAYRFVPMEGCKTCEELKAEHDQAYAIDHARRVEGDGE